MNMIYDRLCSILVPQNKILVPFRVHFQIIRRTPPSLLYGSTPGGEVGLLVVLLGIKNGLYLYTHKYKRYPADYLKKSGQSEVISLQTELQMVFITGLAQELASSRKHGGNNSPQNNFSIFFRHLECFSI